MTDTERQDSPEAPDEWAEFMAEYAFESAREAADYEREGVELLDVEPEGELPDCDPFEEAA